jgi:hypothetical protein
VATAAQITTLGVGQFVVVMGEGSAMTSRSHNVGSCRPRPHRAVGVHACREPLGEWNGAPTMGGFVAGFAMM